MFIAQTTPSHAPILKVSVVSFFPLKQGLAIEDLEDLLVDIKVYMELEEGKNAEFWKVLELKFLLTCL